MTSAYERYVTSRAGHGGEDASITAARQRVMSAENAERDADKALMAARKAVAEARAHVRRLEEEAAEEARLARVKQQAAAKISHRAEPLGRKLNVLLFCVRRWAKGGGYW